MGRGHLIWGWVRQIGVLATRAICNIMLDIIAASVGYSMSCHGTEARVINEILGLPIYTVTTTNTLAFRDRQEWLIKHT